MILVLGGTGEARELAARLDARAVPVTSSLAGRVARPRLPAGAVRIGGFGGPERLAAWLADHDVVAVLDATHPFAARIAASAADACARAAVPLLRLERPGWTARPGDRWTWVDTVAEAADRVAGLGSRVLLTTGRGDLDAFAAVAEPWFLIRCVEPPEGPLPPHHRVLLDRGPYTPQGEGELFDAHRIDLLVTKDSGGPLTAAKLTAARTRRVPVLVVRRPLRPPVETVGDVPAALAWALAHARPPTSR